MPNVESFSCNVLVSVLSRHKYKAANINDFVEASLNVTSLFRSLLFHAWLLSDTVSSEGFSLAWQQLFIFRYGCCNAQLPGFGEYTYFLNFRLRGGFREGRDGCATHSHWFLQSIVFKITSKNYKLCLLKLNWSLLMQLWQIFTQILPKHIWHPVVCCLGDSYYVILTQHQL